MLELENVSINTDNIPSDIKSVMSNSDTAGRVSISLLIVKDSFNGNYFDVTNDYYDSSKYFGNTYELYESENGILGGDAAIVFYTNLAEYEENKNYAAEIYSEQGLTYEEWRNGDDIKLGIVFGMYDAGWNTFITYFLSPFYTCFLYISYILSIYCLSISFKKSCIFMIFS